MAEKVRISKIETDGNGKSWRVILSDGKELRGLQHIAPCGSGPNDSIRVRIDAIIGPSDGEAS